MDDLAWSLPRRTESGWNDQPDVAPGEHQHRRLPRFAALERGELGVLDGEEVLVAPVEVIGEARAEALRGQGHPALDAISLGLDQHGLLAKVHAASVAA